MFAPTKTWRRWHRKINTNQKRYAVASALAASALPSLVMARGHRVDKVSEVPLVLENTFEAVSKTKDAIKILKAVGAFDDVLKAKYSRKLRAGNGKSRDRRHVLRRGPLIVHANDLGLVKAVRNLPGVETANVEALNLLQLAPGGHLGRFIIWTKDAFNKLANIYGSTTRESTSKKGYKLPRGSVNNSDITRIINSDEVQSKVRAAKTSVKLHANLKKNPLKNLGVLVRLNPYALTLRRAELLLQEKKAAAKAAKSATLNAHDSVVRAAQKAHRKMAKNTYNRISADALETRALEQATKNAEKSKTAEQVKDKKAKVTVNAADVDKIAKQLAEASAAALKAAAFNGKQFKALKKNNTVGPAVQKPKVAKSDKTPAHVAKKAAKAVAAKKAKIENLIRLSKAKKAAAAAAAAAKAAPAKGGAAAAKKK
jgi:large subunit ribosomal protein L4e